jgi:cobalt-zinc-cadmium efflux system outer membrane protein
MKTVTTWLWTWPPVILSLALLVGSIVAQSESAFTDDVAFSETREVTKTEPMKVLASVLGNYYHRQTGMSINELIELALKSNLDLAAARLEIDKAKARLQQARLRPNPTLEFEQKSGRLVGDGGDGQISIGASLPIEVFGRRQTRIDVAQIGIEASEAEVRNRERLLVANILTNYAEALAALRELDATEKLLDLDLQTARFVQIRVNEGESPPLELSLLQAEVERLRSRRQLAEGRLESAITQLKLLSGIPFGDTLRLREQLTSAVLPTLPQTRESAIDIALRTRPDVRLTQIEEQVATAGLRLVRAQSKPDVTLYTRYSFGRSSYDAPIPFSQRDRDLAFGLAVGIPLFNKNQGAKAEAAIAIRQAGQRREFAERVVRGEVLAAYQRFEAASRAVSTLENAAIPRSMQNIETFRRVYEIGEIKITELIAEQRRLLDATRDLTEALTLRYKARVDLNIALGGNGFLPDSK